LLRTIPYRARRAKIARRYRDASLSFSLAKHRGKSRYIAAVVDGILDHVAYVLFVVGRESRRKRVKAQAPRSAELSVKARQSASFYLRSSITSSSFVRFVSTARNRLARVIAVANCKLRSGVSARGAGASRKPRERNNDKLIPRESARIRAGFTIYSALIARDDCQSPEIQRAS